MVSFPKSQLSFWKSQTFDKSLETFGLVWVFLSAARGSHSARFPEMEFIKKHRLGYRFLDPYPRVWFSFPQSQLSFWKSQTFEKSLQTFGLVWFFLRFFKSICWYGFFYGFFVVLYLFHQCFIFLCTNIHFIKCYLSKTSFESIFVVYKKNYSLPPNKNAKFLAHL